MEDKKTVIITTAFLAALIIPFVGYTWIMNNKDSIISTRDSQISDLQNQRNQIQTWLDGNKTYYSNQMSDLQNQKNQAQAWLDGNRTYYANEIADKDAQIASLKTQVGNLNSIANLSEYKIIVSDKTINQGPNSVTPVVYLSFPYAGYLHISSTSTTSNAYITVHYWFQEKLFSSTELLGTIGDKLFAVLKSDTAAVYIGNTDLFEGVTHTLTITYYY
jgi:hypothetical protein